MCSWIDNMHSITWPTTTCELWGKCAIHSFIFRFIVVYHNELNFLQFTHLTLHAGPRMHFTIYKIFIVCVHMHVFCQLFAMLYRCSNTCTPIWCISHTWILRNFLNNFSDNPLMYNKIYNVSKTYHTCRLKSQKDNTLMTSSRLRLVCRSIYIISAFLVKN